MIVFGSCVGDEGARHGRLCRPWLERLVQPGDEIIIESGGEGICAAYNRLIDEALSHPDLELLVLLHDDVQLIDPHTRSLLLAAASAPGAGVIGVVGGRGLVGVRWWEASETIGAVYEPRGLLPAGRRAWHGPVDVLDGLLLAFTPEALRRVRFDESRFPAFHGYDVDICAQVAAAGLRVEVVRLDVFHCCKPGVGDPDAFGAAHRAAAAKWPRRFGPQPTWRIVGRRVRRARNRLGGRGLRRGVRGSRALHEIRLGASGAALTAEASRGDTLRVWLVPRPDAEQSLDWLVRMAERAGVQVAEARLVAPDTAELPPDIARRRALYLRDGGAWPVYDLAELVVRAE